MTTRLDVALAERGLARSRTDASGYIDRGQVTVNGVTVRKASHKVGSSDTLEVIGASEYVSRAAQKLLRALDAFGIDPHSRIAVDLGASTGGFTQVLLQRGSSAVVALDVGHDQLDSALRADARVVVVEGENARYLDAERLAALLRARAASFEADAIDLVVGDLSFISLRHILPAIRASVPALRDAVLLIKPQFEVGRAAIRGGIVTSSDAAIDAICEVIECARAEGFTVAGLEPSPITGTHGNAEYLLWLQHELEAASANTTRTMNTVDIPGGWERLEQYVRKIVERQPTGKDHG